MPETLLIVGSTPMQLQQIKQAIQQKSHYTVITANGWEDATAWLRAGSQPQPDLVLIDLALTEAAAGTDTASIIQEIKSLRPHLPVIVVTAYGDEPHTAQALHAGADDFLTKPISTDRMLVSLRNAFKMQRMSHHIARIERQASGQVTFGDVIGQNTFVQKALSQAQQASFNDTPVWIEGEYGTGKELLARAIHGSSARAGKPFITVHCKTLVDDMLAYITDKMQEAGQGTLLLKEADALPLSLQASLLELLPGHPMRIICTSGVAHALAQQMQATVITLPPLRDRREDIVLLARHFVAQYAASENKHMYGLTEQALKHLTDTAWPGNVRQLANLLWRAVLICNQDMLDAGNIRLMQQLQPVHYDNQADFVASGAPMLLDTQGRIKKLKIIEEEAIRFALHYSGGCMTRAARGLGIGRSTLYRRINELDMTGRGSRIAVAVQSN